MTDLEIKQALINIEKAQAENRRLLEMLPHEIERINAEAALAKAEAERVRESREVEVEKMRAENQRLLEMLPVEIEKAKAEVLKLDREWRWYPWLGASGVFALAITLLKLFGH